MTYNKIAVVSKWYTGGDNATAECLPPDDDCPFEAGYAALREVQREAEDHALRTGHVVQVERAQFRTVQR